MGQHACGHHERQMSAVCAACRVRSISVCAALDEDELNDLSSLATDAHFAARETMAAQGRAAEAVFNITEGTVRTYRLLPDGRRQIFGFLLPGDFLGLSLGDMYGFSADAVSPVRACRFARTRFDALVAAKPHLLRRLHEAAGHELALARDHAVLLGRRSADERVAAFLVDLRDRLKRSGAGGDVTVPLAMTREDIADFLGLTIETVSRVFTRLTEKRALIVVPGGIRLTDPAAMAHLAAG